MITRSETIQVDQNAVVPLALAKLHLRVDASFDDDLIGLYLSSAQATAENKTGRAVGGQKTLFYLDCFDAVVFGKSSNDVIAQVDYIPVDGDELTTLDAAFYSMVDDGVDSLRLSFTGSLPQFATGTDSIKVTVNRGYSANECPAAIKSAMLLMIGDQYERREDRGEVGYNSAVDSLLRPYRKW